MSAGISAPHDPHPPRPPLGIHEPHPGPRASLPASLCPPRPIPRCVRILGARAPSPAHHAPSQDVSRQSGQSTPTCGKSHPITSCETLPARAPALPGASSWSAGIPARFALPTMPHHKTCQIMPVDQGQRAGNLTRLQLVEPCRRGRRRSQGGLILVRGHPCPHRFAP